MDAVTMAMGMDGPVGFVLKQEFHTETLSQNNELEDHLSGPLFFESDTSELVDNEMETCVGNVIEIKPIKEDDDTDESILNEVSSWASNNDAGAESMYTALVNSEERLEYQLNVPETEDWDKSVGSSVNVSDEEGQSSDVSNAGCNNLLTDISHVSGPTVHTGAGIDINGNSCNPAEHAECGSAYNEQDEVIDSGENVLLCAHCRRVCKKGFALGHLREHSYCRLYICGRCEKVYMKERCTKCWRAFKDPSLLELHRQLVHPQKPTACEVSVDNVHACDDNVHACEDNVHACDECDEAFINKARLIAHKKRCHRIKGTVTCDKCKVSFTGLSKLARHKRLHGLVGFRVFPCGECDRVFAKEGTLVGHRRKVHGLEVVRRKVKIHGLKVVDSHDKNLTCEICGKKYKCRKSITKHMEEHKHDLIPPQKKLPDTSGLIMSVHHGCEVCGKECGSLSQLTLHRQTHIAGYFCNSCAVRLPNSKMFKNHRELHPGHIIIPLPEKPAEPKVEDAAVVPDDLSSNHTDMVDTSILGENKKRHVQRSLQILKEGGEQPPVHHEAIPISEKSSLTPPSVTEGGFCCCVR